MENLDLLGEIIVKLNTKRTCLVGLAFLSICAFWNLYDFVIPLVLKNTYHLGDTWSGVVMAMDNILALFLLPVFGALSDKANTRIGRRMPFILGGTAAAAALMLALPIVIRDGALLVFLVCLGLLLVAMGTYRSPAVALMPDVTPKPLRSKGNALINLMGAVGGVFALMLIKVAVVRTELPDGAVASDYTYLFVGVAALMVVCAFVLWRTVNERACVAEMEAMNYGVDPSEETVTTTDADGKKKLHPAALRSLIFILCSVAFWFMGYNAVTSAFSKYATTVWGVSEGTAANCLLVATVGAIVSYWPVGQLSSKIGRKKMILCGVTLLAACFLVSGLMKEMTVLMYVGFALVGLAWASINVNSFPMVVELAQGSDTGKYTGYYYTFSMAAQTLTPILSGYLLEHVGYHTLFPYAAGMVALSFVTMCFVHHGDSKPAPKKGLEALDVDD